MSFTKRAPEIAEEILLKAAKLPEGLRSFSKSLLEKEAVDERERLQLPPRMTLADLQKLAHGAGQDIPKVAEVASDDFSDVASQLRKIAERRDQEIAEDVFADAAALVASKIEKEAAGPGVAIRLPKAPPLKRIERITQFLPGTIAREKRLIYKSKLRAERPGTDEYVARTGRERARELDEAAETEAKRRHKTVGEAIKSLPGLGAGAAGVMAAGAALKPGEKKEIKAREVIA